MEEQWIAERARLRELMVKQPDLSIRQLVEATGRSRCWVIKWRQRLKGTALEDEAVLHSHSRRRKHPPAKVHPLMEAAILRLRDELPAVLNRVAGPRTLQYYLTQDASLQQAGLTKPPSTSTIWRVLNAHQRMARPHRPVHEPLERPAPLQDWEIDFSDVPTIATQPGGKRQHAVETLNVVDRGTSILVESLLNDDYHAESALLAILQVFMTAGVPHSLRMDRDPRLVGSASVEGYPSALLRFLLCLDVTVEVCPPHRPDLKPFVERFNKTLEYECWRPENPNSLEAAQPILSRFKGFYNQERPHQGLSCGNQPPYLAFPERPTLRPLPPLIDPDHWLVAYDHQPFKRRVDSNGSVAVNKDSYYIGRQYKGRYVVLFVEAAERQFHVELDGQRLKALHIKGVVGEVLPFDTYVELIRQEARSEWRRWLFTARRLAPLARSA